MSSLDASKIGTICQENQIHFPSSLVTYFPPPYTSCGESLDTTNQETERNVKRKNKKNMQGQGEIPPATTSHAREIIQSLQVMLVRIP